MHFPWKHRTEPIRSPLKAWESRWAQRVGMHWWVSCLQLAAAFAKDGLIQLVTQLSTSLSDFTAWTLDILFCPGLLPKSWAFLWIWRCRWQVWKGMLAEVTTKFTRMGFLLTTGAREWCKAWSFFGPNGLDAVHRGTGMGTHKKEP